MSISKRTISTNIYTVILSISLGSWQVIFFSITICKSPGRDEEILKGQILMPPDYTETTDPKKLEFKGWSLLLPRWGACLLGRVLSSDNLSHGLAWETGSQMGQWWVRPHLNYAYLLYPIATKTSFVGSHWTLLFISLPNVTAMRSLLSFCFSHTCPPSMLQTGAQACEPRAWVGFDPNNSNNSRNI